MAASSEKYYALEDLKDLPLEDAMIIFASKRSAYVYRESGWKVFKFEYKCTETSAQLFDKFWDDIMPKLSDYDIVRESSQIAQQLSYIPNPRNFPPAVPKVCKYVTEKSLYEHLAEQADEEQRRIFNDPKILAMKAHCLDYIKKIKAEQLRDSQAGRGRPSRVSVDSDSSRVSLPPVEQSMVLSGHLKPTRHSLPQVEQSIVANVDLDSSAELGSIEN